MIRLIIFSFISGVLMSSNTLPAQGKVDRKLEAKVQNLVAGFKGNVGIFVKIPILVGVMDRTQKGELTYSQPLVKRDSLLYAGEDAPGSFKQDDKIGLGKVIMLMLTLSDNTASLWLQSLAGTGTRINELMDSLGSKYTRVNSRTPVRKSNRAQQKYI